MTRPRRRVTQKDIARMTGVSQAVVSMVLNNRVGTGVRIAPETRARVLRAIRSTGYVADPAARSLVARRNRIIGVFTAEAVFPLGAPYRPVLAGVEAAAERDGADLLLLSSAPASGGRRGIFRGDERFRLADGLLVLGGGVGRAELDRLAAEAHPCVAVGSPGGADGPVPSVGADLPAAIGALVRRAVRMGHTRLAFVGPARGRPPGLRRTAEAEGAEGIAVPSGPPDTVLDAIAGNGCTAAFVDDPAGAEALAARAEERGTGVPGDLSIAVHGALTPPEAGGRAFSGFAVPHEEMGRAAVGLLAAVLEGGGEPAPLLLACPPVEGATLAPPRRAR